MFGHGSCTKLEPLDPPSGFLRGKKLRMNSGALLFTQGARGDTVYLIREGTVILTFFDGFREYIVRLAGPGETVGGGEVLAGSPHPYTAVTSGDAVVTQVSKQSLIRQLKNDPRSWIELLQSISRDAQSASRFQMNARIRAAAHPHQA